ncbi:MAG TPA: nucleotidyltransferase family protein [Bacilli bacterium]|nr:nucleotidyltransferase family protein [Bacilli bacterium]HPS18507.1 nucleotidyltransferase family protein [Bacilli bacterium]
MIEGIILAGGYSSRAQTNKMLLRFNDLPLILHTVLSLFPHVDHMKVVTGFYDSDIREVFKDFSNVEITNNPYYDKGMFSSILWGIDNVDCDIFILPGDCPFVKSETIVALKNGKGSIRVPAYEGKTGHPIFIDRQLVAKLKKESVDYNLKAFRNRYNYEIINTDDTNILNDIDTINDYRDLNKNLEGK